jgi:ABC-type nitrate/sulfonate/bicarbonate transport system ATPase subunit
VCETRKEIEIPQRLCSAFKGALSSSRKYAAAEIISFEDRLVEDKEEHKKAISNSPMVAEALMILEELHPKKFHFHLKVIDGSFKYTEYIDKNQEETTRSSQIETVYNGAPVQSLFRRLLRTIKGDFSGNETIDHFPIKNVNLYFEQGKTYLVLGAPRSGKSSLLKLIAGILPEDKHHCTGGTVRVNRITPQTENFAWSNIVGYIDQIDRLHPFLTVKETCEFAWKCRNGGTHRTPLHHTGPETDSQIESMDARLWLVTTVLSAMGLTRVQDTFVGDQQTVRGVSGGERKRITVSEMVVGRFPVLCMDEISTGLDGKLLYCIVL